jgi:hypothetical protein
VGRSRGRLGFFRRRSPGRIGSVGRHYDWVAPGTLNIDIDLEVLRREAVQVAVATHGGIRYQEAMELPWDEYEAVLDELRRIAKRSESNASE